jgi:hypothetical protein
METPGITNKEDIQDSVFHGKDDANRFWDSKGPIPEDYLEKGCTNSAKYSDLLASNSHQTPKPVVEESVFA